MNQRGTCWWPILDPFGTFINGRHRLASRLIEDGDVVGFGDVEVRFRRLSRFSDVSFCCSCNRRHDARGRSCSEHMRHSHADLRGRVFPDPPAAFSALLRSWLRAS
jgi:hypothetical protein